MKKLHCTTTLCIAIVCMLLLAACGKPSADVNIGNTETDGTEGSVPEESTPEESLPAEVVKQLRTKENRTKDGEWYSTYEYTYDEYGNETENSFRDASGSYYETTYTYDDRHIRTGGSRTEHRVLANAVDDITYTYDYDEYGYLNRTYVEQKTYYTEESRQGADITKTTYYFYDALGTEMGQAVRQDDHSTLEVSIPDYRTAPRSPERKEGETYDEEGRLIRKEVHTAMTEYVETYEYDPAGNKIRETLTYNEGTADETVYDTVVTYEERTCKTIPAVLPPTEEKQVIYAAKTTLASGENGYTYYYAYDKYGRQVCGYSDDLLQYEYNEWDENGKVTRVWSDEFVTDIIYDENGNRVREDFHNQIGEEPVAYADCECDEDGRVIRSVTHVLAYPDVYGDLDGTYQEFEYNENGNLTVTQSFDASGTLLQYEERSYGDGGLAASVTLYNGDGSVISSTEVSYTSITVLAAG